MNHYELEEYFLNYLEGRSDNVENRRLGTEYEMFILQPCGQTSGKYRPCQMEGKCGVYRIISVLEELSRQKDILWEQHFEKENLIGLSNNCKQSITIEPGGQIEFAGAPLQELKDIKREITNYLNLLKQSVHECGGKILSIGVNPLFPLEDIPIVGKQRYHIMFPYMKEVGTLGQYMMKATASTQVSIDYFSLEDLRRKYVVLNRLSPFLIAIFANSPLFDGGNSQYKSFRGHIWQHTDPHRSGLPEAFLKEDFQLKDYIDWALEAPTYFITRDNTPIPCTQFTFREMLEGKHPDLQVNASDWKSHLGTLFPDVRIKNIIEIRTPDALFPEDMIAVPALIKALIYNESGFEKLQNLLMDLPLEHFSQFREAAGKEGLQAEVQGIQFMKMAHKIFEEALHILGSTEEQYLLPYFEKYTKQGKSPADKIIENFNHRDQQDVWKWIHPYLAESFPEV